MDIHIERHAFFVLLMAFMIAYTLSAPYTRGLNRKNILLANGQKKEIPETTKQDAEEINQNMRIFDYTDNGAEFKIGLREKFKVELSENPTTGYIWDVSASTPQNISLMDKKFRSTQKDGPILGGGGIRIFIFQAVKPGRAELTLLHRRPWEKENTHMDTFSIQLLVE